MNNKIVKVYDTITGKMVDVEVSQEIYTEYMRTEWGIKNNDNSFYNHEIQFSQLIGGDDGAFENFREFKKPNYDYEPWYKNHSWDYTKLRAGAPFVYLKQHPEMFKNFYVYMKCLKAGDVPFKSYIGNNIVDYACLLEIDPKTAALDNTDSVISLVETRLLRFFDKSSVELILSGKQLFPVRFVFG
jgi:hypothetical protein